MFVPWQCLKLCTWCLRLPKTLVKRRSTNFGRTSTFASSLWHPQERVFNAVQHLPALHRGPHSGMTIGIYRDPLRMVENVSALGRQHVNSGTPTELVGAFVAACVEVVTTITKNGTTIVSCHWSLGPFFGNARSHERCCKSLVDTARACGRHAV